MEAARSGKRTVKEIADMFGVTRMGVYYWIKNGLNHEKEKVVGIKERIIIDPDDVVQFLRLTDARIKDAGGAG